MLSIKAAQQREYVFERKLSNVMCAFVITRDSFNACFF